MALYFDYHGPCILVLSTQECPHRIPEELFNNSQIHTPDGRVAESIRWDVFVLYDNSNDSSVLGCVDKEQVLYIRTPGGKTIWENNEVNTGRVLH